MQTHLSAHCPSRVIGLRPLPVVLVQGRGCCRIPTTFQREACVLLLG